MHAHCFAEGLSRLPPVGAETQFLGSTSDRVWRLPSEGTRQGRWLEVRHLPEEARRVQELLYNPRSEALGYRTPNEAFRAG